jgi:uncharacterized membrane protein
MQIILISALILVVLDSIYLNSVKNYFGKQIKLVQGSPMRVNLGAAVATYIFLIFGLNYFILQKNASVTDAFFLGLVIYAVFELTNMALFSKWSLMTVLIDSTWGGILFALATWLTYKIRKLVK